MLGSHLDSAKGNSMAKKRKKKKKATKTRKKRAGISPIEAQPSVPRWYSEGLTDWSTEAIFDQLEEYGLETDAENFSRDVEDCLEPSELADIWTRRVDGAPGRWRDFFHFAARELWRRLLPHRDCLDFLAEDLHEVDIFGDTESRMPEVEKIRRDLDRLDSLIHRKAQREGKTFQEAFDHIDNDFDFGVWIQELPQMLALHGFVDDAVAVSERYAFVNPENMLGDLPQILAEHGRCPEALARAEETVKNLSEDPWVLIKAGDAYELCGESQKAVDLYNQALEVAESSYPEEGVYERLVPLLKKLGRQKEAEEAMEAWDLLQAGGEKFQEPAPLRAAKIGRNEPCPCGSGKKYKKCCLAEHSAARAEEAKQKEEAALRSQLRPRDRFLIMMRDIHHQGSWEDLSRSSAAEDDWIIAPEEISRLRKHEKEVGKNLADILLTGEDQETVATAIARAEELKARARELEADHQLTREEEAELWTIRLIFAGRNLPDEVVRNLIRLGDAAAGKLVDVATDEFFQQMLAPGRGWAPMQAVKILGEMKAERYIPELADLLGEDADLLREEASRALVKIGAPAMETLLKIVREKPKTLKQLAAAEVLAELPADEQIFQAAYELIQEGEPEERPDFLPFAVDLLKKCKDQQAREVIRGLLEKDDISEASRMEIEFIWENLEEEA